MVYYSRMLYNRLKVQLSQSGDQGLYHYIIMVKAVLIFSSLFLILSLFIYWIAPKVQIIPQLLRIDENVVKSLEGVEIITLDDGALLFEGKIIGPESISHDPVTGNIFTGTADGLLWKINKDLTHAEILLRIGEDHPECGLAEYQNVCGRILGLKYFAENKLIVADAYKGIILIHVNSKKKQVLIESDKNPLTSSLKIFNSVDVSKEGVIYFTVSSMKWSLHDFIYSIFEGDSTGRLYSYNLVTEELNLLVSNPSFANGLVISHDDNMLLVAECTNRRVLKFNIKQSMKRTVFIDNLSGPVDNIKRGSNGNYLVAIPSFGDLKKFSFIAKYPFINEWLMWLVPKRVLQSSFTFDSKVLVINEEGKIEKVIEGTNDKIKCITEAYETKENIIFGSLINNFLLTVKKNKKDFII